MMVLRYALFVQQQGGFTMYQEYDAYALIGDNR